jgi:uncharacterized linocin/CFP29 family protein
MESFQKNVEYPLDEAQHKRIRESIVKEATRTVVGRYFIEVYGPLGAGLETVSFETFAADELAQINLEGGLDAKIATPREEVYRRIPIIYKDFELHWRDVDFARKNGSPLDVTRAIRAAHFVADREDDLIFNGSEDLTVEGLLNCKGRGTTSLGDWTRFGVAFDSIQTATEKLLSLNHHRPYACVLSPHLYASLLKVKEGQQFLELDQIQRLCTDGVYQSPSVPAQKGVVVSTGSQNFDLAVAQDLDIAFLGPKTMNYQFRVFESVVLRIKRPSAVCTLE